MKKMKNNNKENVFEEYSANQNHKDLYQLIAESSIHGLPKIFKTESRFLKVIWIFFFIIFTCLCSW